MVKLRDLTKLYLNTCSHQTRSEEMAKIIANNATKLPYNSPPSYRRNTSDDVDESKNSYKNTECEDQQIVRQHESKTNGYQSKGASKRIRGQKMPSWRKRFQSWRESTVTPTAQEQIFNSTLQWRLHHHQEKRVSIGKISTGKSINLTHVKKYHGPAEEREEEEIEYPTTKEIPFPQPRKEEQQESQNHLND